MSPERPGPWTGGEEATFGDVRETERLVDLLAARTPVGGSDDELVRLLAGWAAVVDEESAAATRPVRGRGGAADIAAALSTSGVRPVRPVRPLVPERRRRTPWWALSAGAAAVIAVMAVGLGLQDAAPVGPVAVAESVQSVEATLVAARLAAEGGDAVGARSLLERARELVAALPADERARFDAALGAAEEGVAIVEAAVRLGEPVPALPPWPDVPGVPDVPGGERPDVPASPAARPSQAATPGQPAVPGGQGQGGEEDPDEDGGDTPAPTPPTAKPTKAPKPTATATAAPAPVPAPTTTAPTTTEPEPAPTRTKGGGPKTTRAAEPPADPPGQRPGGGGGRPTDKGGPPGGDAAAPLVDPAAVP